MKDIEKKALKQKYEFLFDLVRAELNKLDPMRLSPGKDCPIDEYDPETERILPRLNDGMTYAELAENICAIFSEMFGESFSAGLFYDCAENILSGVRLRGVGIDEKQIDAEKLYSYFRSAIGHCGTFLLSASNEDISYHIFEEFDADCISFLSDRALDTLLSAGYISDEIHSAAADLAQEFRALENTRLWNIDAVRNSAEWLHILSLADKIIGMLYKCVPIEKIALGENGILSVTPQNASYDMIYRAAMGARWNSDNRCLYFHSPIEQKSEIVEIYGIILNAVADEYGDRLRPNSETVYINIDADIIAKIQNLQPQ